VFWLTRVFCAKDVQDLYFLHERGAKMGWYMNAIAGGNTLGPLICGFIVSNLSWRWHKWIAVILTAINFVCVVLFVPETRYQRSEKRHEEGVDVAPLQDKVIHADMRSVRRTSDESVQQVPKKTFVQELSLWSDVAQTNLFKMFLRYVATSWRRRSIANLLQSFPHDRVSSSHIFVPMLLHLTRHRSGYQHPEPLRAASATIQLESPDQWPD
jgi:MFS family permease